MKDSLKDTRFPKLGALRLLLKSFQSGSLGIGSLSRLLCLPLSESMHLRVVQEEESILNNMISKGGGGPNLIATLGLVLAHQAARDGGRGGGEALAFGEGGSGGLTKN